MTIEELRDLCAKSEYVVLVLPRKRLPKGSSVRLTPSAGPLGKNLSAKDHGDWFEVISCFKSADIIRWLNKEGSKQ